MEADFSYTPAKWINLTKKILRSPYSGIPFTSSPKAGHLIQCEYFQGEEGPGECAPHACVSCVSSAPRRASPTSCLLRSTLSRIPIPTGSWASPSLTQGPALPSPGLQARSCPEASSDGRALLALPGLHGLWRRPQTPGQPPLHTSSSAHASCAPAPAALC